MPREAKVARKSREPDLARAMKKLQQLRARRPGANIPIRAAQAELNVLLKDWEESYQKECFYNGLLRCGTGSFTGISTSTRTSSGAR
jgi:hypothetical protein